MAEELYASDAPREKMQFRVGLRRHVGSYCLIGVSIVAAVLLHAPAVWAQAVPPPILHYPFTEAASEAVQDIAGGTTAQLHGILWIKNGEAAAVDLDGVSNSIDGGDPPAARIASGSLSFSVWLRTNAQRQQYVLTHFGWSLYLDAGLRPHFETRSADNSRWEDLGAPQPIPLNEWTHIVCVYDEAQRQARLYVNGLLAAAQEKAPGFGGLFRSKLVLGVWPPGAHFFSGLLGDTRIWNVPLTDTHVRALYESLRPRYPSMLASPKRRISARLHRFTASERLAVEIFLRNLEAPWPKAGALVELMQEGRHVASKSVSLSPEGRAEAVFSTARMPSGRYRVRVTATANEQPISDVSYETAWQKTTQKPFWLGSAEGLSGRLMPPWTPVQTCASGSTASLCCWGRMHSFAATPLPSEITTGGRSLLSGPIRLITRAAGHEQRWRTPRFVVYKRSPEQGLIEMRCQAADLALGALFSLGYDGLLRVDLALRPLRKVRVERLTLEIPFLSEYARYLYYYPDRHLSWDAHRPGLIPPAGLAMSFNPALWLGDEKGGLQWLSESDKNWLPADEERAIRIQPQGRTTLLRIEWIGRPIILDPQSDNLVVGRADSVKELSYTFGLMATPVKPRERDAWDLRSTTLYADVYKAMEAGPDGQSLLDQMQAYGVRSLSLMDWTDILCDNRASDLARLRRFVTECHKRGIQVLVYFGFQISDALPEFPLYMEDAACWGAPREYAYEAWLDNYPGKPVQNMYRVCYQSLWQDFVVAGAARLMDEADIDGVYLDGTTIPQPCYNRHHGCGYHDGQGRWKPTVPIFACRRFAQRLYIALRSRKPNAQINLHNSAYMIAPSIAWATSLWDGEHLSAPPETFLLDRLPLDMFRTEFMGHNWGVPQEFLEYMLPGDFRTEWGLTLLHDVPTRPYGAEEQLPFAARLWQLMDRFGRQEAQWIPYWENAEYLSIQPSSVCVSLYRHAKNGVLLIIDNTGRSKAETQIKINLARLEMPLRAHARDALTDEPLALNDATLSLSLAPLEWKAVWIRP